MANCELCARDQRLRKRVRSRLGPGAKVTLDHLLRALKVSIRTGELQRHLRPLELSKDTRDALDRTLFRAGSAKPSPRVESKREK